jgi:hypothetical protein
MLADNQDRSVYVVIKNSLPRIEPQISFAMLLIGPMALKAIVGKDGPNLAREVDLWFSGRDYRSYFFGNRLSSGQEQAERDRRAKQGSRHEKTPAWSSWFRGALGTSGFSQLL